jgi:hypothetical protein
MRPWPEFTWFRIWTSSGIMWTWYESPCSINAENILSISPAIKLSRRPLHYGVSQQQIWLRRLLSFMTIGLNLNIKIGPHYWLRAILRLPSKYFNTKHPKHQTRSNIQTNKLEFSHVIKNKIGNKESKSVQISITVFIHGFSGRGYRI